LNRRYERASMEGQFLMRGYKLLCSSSEGGGGVRCMRGSRTK